MEWRSSCSGIVMTTHGALGRIPNHSGTAAFARASDTSAISRTSSRVAKCIAGIGSQAAADLDEVAGAQDALAEDGEFGIDAGDFLESDGVDLVGGEAQRGVDLDRALVGLHATRDVDQARLLVGSGERAGSRRG